MLWHVTGRLKIERRAAVHSCVTRTSVVMTLAEKATAKAVKDMAVLGRFVAVYCRDKHSDRPKTRFTYRGIEDRVWRDIELCDECARLLAHGTAKRLLCPLDPKPSCKHCEIHCYAPGHRERVREIMRYSGKKLMRRGRVDLIYHYFF